MGAACAEPSSAPMRAIFAATGVHTRIMRPPFGARDWLVLDEVRKLGYTPVMWSVPLANDWEYPPAASHRRRVLRYVGDGAIIDPARWQSGDRLRAHARAGASVRPQRGRRSDALIVESLKRAAIAS